jgi:hypothetical protein
MKGETYFRTIVLLASTLCHAFSGTAQSGGSFQITQSVIGGGGGSATGGSFALDGTIAEPVAGTTSTGGPFRLASGFWGGDAPASANVTISGRVSTPAGLGLRNAIVSLIDSQNVRRLATTSSFGLYSFDNVRTGETYIITVGSKRYRFSPRIMPINSALNDVDFVGLE